MPIQVISNYCFRSITTDCSQVKFLCLFTYPAKRGDALFFGAVSRLKCQATSGYWYLDVKLSDGADRLKQLSVYTSLDIIGMLASVPELAKTTVSEKHIFERVANGTCPINLESPFLTTAKSSDPYDMRSLQSSRACDQMINRLM